MARIRRRFGRHSISSLRSKMEEVDWYTPYRIAWLGEVIEALEASGFERLNDVPEELFFAVAHA